ncbi:ectonucleotide pyrophosphatase/phosphodiesterase family member 3-like [Acipenser oxyrinchus oxyrinchus]|uniref:Ectonucleotide pyrophosphatase/phosphodiesterase family member 3-like n=1 Tax=Acipenser oxyrinchus oxyrinchus TaxID=40147 RepID=A0AAD8GAJ0_ACIOX|nr:ectonucleotide pyrophosphatase/phosphodiesterase family member 3-like [Acipenser oxyrinchus oxyrinchus]
MKEVDRKESDLQPIEGSAATPMLGTVEIGDQDKSTDRGKKRKKSNTCKILIGVLLLCLLIIILAFVFGLGLRYSEEGKSCKKRCHLKASGSGCHCDTSCLQLGNCCLDFQEVCRQPAQDWTCTKFRCGEQRLLRSHCFCSNDCLTKGDCCTNYNSVCQGEKSWVEEDCEDIDTPQCPAGFSRPPVILFSLDGFRAEYLQTWGGLMPAISKLKQCGTSAPYMRPVYPTKTFPNHYSIVTGLYPESHGIVDNHIYDVTQNATFSLKVKEKFNPSWYQGQPIWLTAKYQNLKSGTFFWPGSDVEINETYPDIYQMYNKGIPFEERIFTLLKWLRLPSEERPDMITLYLEEPDSSGHRFGPVSSAVIQALIRVDKMVAMLMDGLKQRNLHNCVNLVLLSDHGMEEASCKKAEYISEYMDNVDSFIIVPGPAARLRPKNLPEDFFTFDYEGIVKNLSCKTPGQNFKPYMKQHLPKRFHFASNIRIEPVHFYMNSQWQAAQKPGGLKYCTGGFHGSDNLFKNMEAIFIGHGPGIASKNKVEPFENIEVYNLLCDLLNITPAPNNGTHGSLNHILKRPVYSPVHPTEVSSPDICSVTTLLPTDTLGCQCSSHSNSEVENLNKQLELNVDQVNTGNELHMPFGRPRVLQQNAKYCLLYHPQYINGYSQDFLMPLWSAYTVQKFESVSSLQPGSADCLRADVRIPANQSQSCLSYKKDPNLTFGFLHPPNLGPPSRESDSLITSNTVPMYTAFKDSWIHFHSMLLLKYAKERNGLNVISGPVFDYNYDGHFDTSEQLKQNIRDTKILIPTHYFVVLTSCKNSSYPPEACNGSLDVSSFIIPHRPDNTESCTTGTDLQWVEEWLKFHVARVRDIELLTGLSFYQDRRQPVTEILQLKTFLQTFQNED